MNCMEQLIDVGKKEIRDRLLHRLGECDLRVCLALFSVAGPESRVDGAQYLGDEPMSRWEWTLTSGVHPISVAIADETRRDDAVRMLEKMAEHLKTRDGDTIEGKEGYFPGPSGEIPF